MKGSCAAFNPLCQLSDTMIPLQLPVSVPPHAKYVYQREAKAHGDAKKPICWPLYVKNKCMPEISQGSGVAMHLRCGEICNPDVSMRLQSLSF